MFCHFSPIRWVQPSNPRGENMRKFWRIGLILVIGLSACGDKKAEQAKALQEEMQSMLAKAASRQDVHLWRRHGDARTATP